MYNQHLRIVSCTPGESLDMPRRLHAVLLLAFCLIVALVWYTAFAIIKAMELCTRLLFLRSVPCRHTQVCVRPAST